jgi:hypothetical protein
MKNLLFTLLFIPSLLIAQNRPDWDYDFNRPISPDFVKLPVSESYLPTQNTYYEYNWVANNLRLLIEQNLNLNYQDAENEWNDNYIVDVYKTPAGRVIDNLKIKYNVFQLYGLPVVESIEISGSYTQVTKLFIWLYNTKFQSGDLTSDQFIKTYAQDDCVYSLNDGVATIRIKNSVFNRSDFVSRFNTEKEKFKRGLN